MKKFFAFIIIIFSSYHSFSQNDFSEIKLEEEADYAIAEPKVLKAANYLLSAKFDADDLERLYATKLVINWMAGTPDFTFEVNEKCSRAFAQDPDIMNLYMIALAKYALEHKDKSKDAAIVGVNAAKLVIEYTNKTTNRIKQTSELKKMSAALKKGELEKYLGI